MQVDCYVETRKSKAGNDYKVVVIEFPNGFKKTMYDWSEADLFIVETLNTSTNFKK